MSDTTYVRVPVAQLRANPANIRRDLGDIEELADSLEALGVLQPLVIAEPAGGTALVIDGHRRLAAAHLAGFKAVPCIISPIEPGEQTLTVMLAAAMHKQLEPVEQAAAFQALIDQGLTKLEIAQRTGYSQTTVANRLLLQALPPDTRAMVAAKEITLGQAQNVARLVVRRSGGAVDITGHDNRSNYFGGNHRLSGEARSRCGDEHAARHVVMGGACGICWEQAIRADERDENITPRDDIDELAVARAVSGDRTVPLNVSEREEAVRQLSGQGMSDSEVARRLGITARTVLRCRQRAGIGTSAFSRGRRVTA